MRLKRIITLFICSAVILSLFACSRTGSMIKADNLMEGKQANKVTGKDIEDSFTKSIASFSVSLFKGSFKNGDNTLVSPVSVLLALAMTANGAANSTLKQMEDVLAEGYSVDEINEYLYTYLQALPYDDKVKLDIANSIWYDSNRVNVKEAFLQKNADYYNVDAYLADFQSKDTLNDINNWVKNNTGGLIEKILDKIDPDALMYLINTVLFEAEWKQQFSKDRVNEGKFNNLDGSKSDVWYMYSTEGKYLEGDKERGFAKYYEGNTYSFVAILPEGDIAEYVANLDGNKFIDLLNDMSVESVNIQLPKFSYSFNIELNDVLKGMGILDAFDPVNADFSDMASEKLYIGNVLHKSFIRVNEIGTKAGAATVIMIPPGSGMNEDKIVILDRPFVYAIVDTNTNLPIFIGCVTNI